MKQVDAAIKEIVEAYGDQYFEKPEVINNVLARPQVASVVKQLRQQFPGWGLDNVLAEAVGRRLDHYLVKKQAVNTPQGQVKIRVYECYATGQGPRRWQRLKSMTASELRICVQERRKRMALELRTIRVYEQIIDMLEGKPQTAKVKDVFDQALEEVAAAIGAGQL